MLLHIYYGCSLSCIRLGRVKYRWQKSWQCHGGCVLGLILRFKSQLFSNHPWCHAIASLAFSKDRKWDPGRRIRVPGVQESSSLGVIVIRYGRTRCDGCYDFLSGIDKVISSMWVPLSSTVERFEIVNWTVMGSRRKFPVTGTFILTTEVPDSECFQRSMMDLLNPSQPLKYWSYWSSAPQTNRWEIFSQPMARVHIQTNSSPSH